jgi:hypothetical protein
MGRQLKKFFIKLLAAVGIFSTLFGFNTFIYSKKTKKFSNSKCLCLFCKFMAVTFFLAYPIALVSQDYKNFIPKGVSDYARFSLSIVNWLLCTVIYLNQASNAAATCAIYNRAIDLHQRFDFVPEHVRGDLSFSLTSKCVVRSSILLLGFLFVNYVKFNHLYRSDDGLFAHVLLLYLFLPNVTVTLASNRFYMASAYCLYLIEVGNENLKSFAVDFEGFGDLKEISLLTRNLPSDISERIRISAANHTLLHQLFMDFNGTMAKYIPLIIAYCISNVIFEVTPTIFWVILKIFIKNCHHPQLFFLYVNMSASLEKDTRLGEQFVYFSCIQTFLFLYEFISLILINNKLKIASEECASILHNLSICFGELTSTEVNGKRVPRVCCKVH